jgi:hypothetical protein
MRLTKGSHRKNMPKSITSHGPQTLKKYLLNKGIV